jgi:hypothetical protein
MSLIMRGPTLLRAIIQGFLADAIPAAVDVMREQYELTEYQLPYPARYDTVDLTVVGNDEFPTIGAVVLSGRDFVRTDIGEEAEQEYMPTYPTRIMVVARTPLDENEEWEEPVKDSAIRLTQDLAQLMLNCILQTPSFGAPEAVRMNEESVSIDYMDAIMPNTQSKRFAAMASIACDIQFRETTYAVKYGDANTITLVTDKLPMEGP